MWFSSGQEFFPVINNDWRIILGSSTLILGAIISLLGVIEFKKANTTVDPRIPGQTSHLVVSGIYRLSRNPMYVGFLLMLLAWAIYLSEGTSYLFLPLFVVYMNRFQISPEERFMKLKFGDDFSNYMIKVRRWI